MLFDYILISIVIIGTIEGQVTYLRNDIICKNFSTYSCQYSLTINGEVYTLNKNYEYLTKDPFCAKCELKSEFTLTKMDGNYTLNRTVTNCEVGDKIKLENLFSSDYSTEVDITCINYRRCVKYRYDRNLTSVTSTDIGPCIYGACYPCSFSSRWQVNSSNLLLERTYFSCSPSVFMNIFDYFSTADSTKWITTQKVSIESTTIPTSSTATPSIASSSIASSSIVTSITTKSLNITEYASPTKNVSIDSTQSGNINLTNATSSSVTSIATKSPNITNYVSTTKNVSIVSTTKSTQSILFWNFGLITTNLISCLWL